MWGHWESRIFFPLGPSFTYTDSEFCIWLCFTLWFDLLKTWRWISSPFLVILMCMFVYDLYSWLHLFLKDFYQYFRKLFQCFLEHSGLQVTDQINIWVQEWIYKKNTMNQWNKMHLQFMLWTLKPEFPIVLRITWQGIYFLYLRFVNCVALKGQPEWWTCCICFLSSSLP